MHTKWTVGICPTTVLYWGSIYSRARLIRMANAWKNHANYPSMRIIQAYFTLCFINGRELCPEQACELSGVCEWARVKLSGLYCIRNTWMPCLKFFMPVEAMTMECRRNFIGVWRTPMWSTKPVFQNPEFVQTESQWIAILVSSRRDVVTLWHHVRVLIPD